MHITIRTNERTDEFIPIRVKPVRNKEPRAVTIEPIRMICSALNVEIILFDNIAPNTEAKATKIPKSQILPETYEKTP